MSDPRHNPDNLTGDPAGSGTDPGLRAAFGEAAQALQQLVGSTAELAAVEARRAVTAVGWILALGVGIAATVLAAWALAGSTLAFWLVAEGWSWGRALLLVAGLNLLAALLMALAIWRLASRLGFPALRRTLFRDRRRQTDVEPHQPVGTAYTE